MCRGPLFAFRPDSVSHYLKLGSVVVIPGSSIDILLVRRDEAKNGQ
jgi:hypothetical protein